MTVRHPFQPGERQPNARGRMMTLCDVAGCDAPRNAPRHRVEGYVPAHRTTGDVPATVPDRPPASWQAELLALACDQAIDAGPAIVGWRVFIRAQSLRDAIGPVHKARPKPASLVDDESGPIHIVGKTHSTPVDPAVARARVATKGIRHDRMRELATRALAAGASMRRNGGGHMVLTGGPLTSPLTFSATSSGEGRAWLNVRRDAARKGLDVSGL